jgi:hypothetical protein
MSQIFAVFVALLLNLVFAFMSSRETSFWLRLRRFVFFRGSLIFLRSCALERLAVGFRRRAGLDRS